MLYDLWSRTEGGSVAKLLKLGVTKVDEQWAIRLMGAPGNGDIDKGSAAGPVEQFLDADGVPYAFILQKNSNGQTKLQVRDSLNWLPGKARKALIDTATGEVADGARFRFTLNRSSSAVFDVTRLPARSRCCFSHARTGYICRGLREKAPEGARPASGGAWAS